MSKDRIRNITGQSNGLPYANVVKHKRWVQYLRDHSYQFTWTDEDASHIFDWAKSSVISLETLRSTIYRHSHLDT